MNKPKQKQSKCPQSKALIKEKICIKWCVLQPLKISKDSTGMVVHTFVTSTERRQTGGSCWVPGQPGLHIKHQTSKAKWDPVSKHGKASKIENWLQHGWTSKHHIQKLKEDNQKRQVLWGRCFQKGPNLLTYPYPEKGKWGGQVWMVSMNAPPLLHWPWRRQHLSCGSKHECNMYLHPFSNEKANASLRQKNDIVII